MRPVLSGVHDGNGSGFDEGVGDEGISADRNQRIGPDDEEDAASRLVCKFRAQISEALLKLRGEGCTILRSSENISQFRGGSDDFIHGVRIGFVHGNVQPVEGADSFKAIGGGDQNEIGMERGDLFNAGVDDAADFGDGFGFRGIVAIIGVADEVGLLAQGVNGFSETRGERDDAAYRLRDFDGSAEFVLHFAVDRNRWGNRGDGGWRRFFFLRG